MQNLTIRNYLKSGKKKSFLEFIDDQVDTSANDLIYISLTDNLLFIATQDDVYYCDNVTSCTGGILAASLTHPVKAPMDTWAAIPFSRSHNETTATMGLHLCPFPPRSLSKITEVTTIMQGDADMPGWLIYGNKKLVLTIRDGCVVPTKIDGGITNMVLDFTKIREERKKEFNQLMQCCTFITTYQLTWGEFKLNINKHMDRFIAQPSDEKIEMNSSESDDIKFITSKMIMLMSKIDVNTDMMSKFIQANMDKSDLNIHNEGRYRGGRSPRTSYRDEFESSYHLNHRERVSHHGWGEKRSYHGFQQMDDLTDDDIKSMIADFINTQLRSHWGDVRSDAFLSDLMGIHSYDGVFNFISYLFNVIYPSVVNSSITGITDLISTQLKIIKHIENHIKSGSIANVEFDTIVLGFLIKIMGVLYRL